MTVRPPVKLGPLFKDALYGMLAHKVRTSLTLLGMVFGVGAVIAMISIGEGGEREALALIDSLGLRNIVIEAKEIPDQELKELREHSVGLTLRDLEVAETTLPFVTGSSAEKTVRHYALFSLTGDSDAEVLGVTPSYFGLSSLEVAEGRLFDITDDAERAQAAVLGATAARDLFPDMEPDQIVGQLVKVDHLWVEVVGVLQDRVLSKEEFEGVKIGAEANRVFLPLNTVLSRFRFQPLDDELDAYRLQVAEGVEPTAAARAATQLMDRRHADQDDYRIVVPAELMAQHRETRRIFNLVMSAVAGISLLVGGIGITNIMLASILERTREIGLLRAVGATRRDIRLQFLAETLTICAIGSLLGIVAGALLAFAISAFAGWPAAWSMPSVIVAVVVCTAIGLAFGIFPAMKASELDPIRALQTE